MNENPKEAQFWAKQHAILFSTGKITKEDFKKHIINAFNDEHNYYLKALISLGVIQLVFRFKK